MTKLRIYHGPTFKAQKNGACRFVHVLSLQKVEILEISSFRAFFFVHAPAER